MQVTKSGSVRVDLVGGTLDLEPINLILPNVVTLNVATSLKAQVSVKKTETSEIKIISEDYNKEYNVELKDLTFENLYENNTFMEMTFLLQLIDYFKIPSGLEIRLKSGAPAGSGLGGSSAMGVTFFSALCDLYKYEASLTEKIQIVKAIEARILGQGITGYQDYYPALTGGILGLVSLPGRVMIDQLYTEELAEFLEDHITLIYSGISRDSGINNWEVYKAFFDKNGEIKKHLKEIALISHDTFTAIKEKEYLEVLKLIGREGEARESLSKNIVPQGVHDFFAELKSSSTDIYGMKMCGAGGGGCFILTHGKKSQDAINKLVERYNFKILDFKVDRPLNEY